MTPERWRRVQEVFAAATERAPEAQAAFLDEACSDDPELRAEVASLLSSLGEASSGFLESPAIGAVPALLPTGRTRPVSLARGTCLGPYEILSALGAGGMGEVYRASDPRLGREVAVKVLAVELSLDASRVKRFEKEARSASALNHPNIVTVYDIGLSDGVPYIAMEKVEGETLRKLVSSGAVPIKKLLAIAAQIADGLARAHQAGIVHRDLKPENLMVTKDGLVKILDFGLAKLTSTGSGSVEGSRGPAMTGTMPGVILGTVGYMSPEQGSGAALDSRSDQFSFGSILYELVTGKRAFQGKTPIDTLGAILNDEPESIAAINPRVPTALRWIIERCLAKDPRQRYSSTDDLARDLAKLRDHLSEATTGVSRTTLSRRRLWVLPMAVGAMVIAIAAVGLLRLRTPSPAKHPIRFTVAPPANTSIGGGFHPFAFSPDGSQLAFRANPFGSEPPRIWLRPLAEAEARPIVGTENVDSLFWSPDGRSIGYFATGKLWRVNVSGGPPVPICDVNANSQYAGSWGADGEILFARFPGDAIYRVSSSEGKPAAILRPDRARGEMTVSWPWFLPDGKTFLYLSQNAKDGTLMLSSLGGASRSLFPLRSRVEYVEPGYLVFAREGTLFAQRFDPRNGRLSGEPLSITDALRYAAKDGLAAFSSSRNGALAFGPRPNPRRRMAWFDRTGRGVDTLDALAPLGQEEANDVAIDSEGRRVLFDRSQPKTRVHNLWILDVERKTEVRVTSDSTDERSARWLPDGKSIVYTAGVGGLVQLRRRDLTTGRVEALLPFGEDQQAGPVVHGGKQLMYATVTEEGNAESRLVSLSGRHEISALPHATAFDEAGLLSPDGRLILLASNASGRDEISIAPAASPTERIQVSSGGAFHGIALWSHDGSEVFYLSPERKLMSVSVSPTPSLRVGKPVTLFTTRVDAAWDTFDVSPDGTRFLAVYSEGAPEPLPVDVILNWTTLAAIQVAR